MEKSITYKAMVFKRSETHYLKKREEWEWLKVNDGEWECFNQIRPYFTEHDFTIFNKWVATKEARKWLLTTGKYLTSIPENELEETTFDIKVRMIPIIEWDNLCK